MKLNELKNLWAKTGANPQNVTSIWNSAIGEVLTELHNEAMIRLHAKLYDDVTLIKEIADRINSMRGK